MTKQAFGLNPNVFVFTREYPLLYKAKFRYPSEYCIHEWDVTSSTCFFLFDQVRQSVIRLIDNLSLISASQSRAHPQAVVVLSFFNWYYLVFLSFGVYLVSSRSGNFFPLSSCTANWSSISRYCMSFFSIGIFRRATWLWNTFQLYALPPIHNLFLCKGKINKVAFTWPFLCSSLLRCILTVRFRHYVALKFLSDKKETQQISQNSSYIVIVIMKY